MNDLIKIKIKNVPGIPFDFEVIKMNDENYEVPSILVGNSDEIKERISNLRGWARMLLSKEVLIRRKIDE